MVTGFPTVVPLCDCCQQSSRFHFNSCPLVLRLAKIQSERDPEKDLYGKALIRERLEPITYKTSPCRENCKTQLLQSRWFALHPRARLRPCLARACACPDGLVCAARKLARTALPSGPARSAARGRVAQHVLLSHFSRAAFPTDEKTTTRASKNARRVILIVEVEPKQVALVRRPNMPPALPPVRSVGRHSRLMLPLAPPCAQRWASQTPWARHSGGQVGVWSIFPPALR